MNDVSTTEGEITSTIADALCDTMRNIASDWLSNRLVKRQNSSDNSHQTEQFNTMCVCVCLWLSVIRTVSMAK